MPGVTVTAESPALIEKARSITTDDHGEYKVEDLRPGTYTVTFSMPGFATIKRAGLDLNTGITLPVDAEMQVGSMSQSVTVTSGATPVVDVENSSPQNILTHETLESIPQGGGIPAYTETTLGATQTGAPDVGGNKGEELDSILIHDSRTNDDDELLDGMSWSSGQSTGGLGQRSFVINKISVEELSVSTGAAGAEAGHPGANVNIVPRTGGDRFHGAINGTGATTAWQAKNLDSALAARGLNSGQNIKYTYDLGAGLGGPIKRGKLWFWVGYGQWAADNYAPGNYFNATQNTLFYTPDLKRQAYTHIWNYATDLRLDYQASLKDKISVYQAYEDFCICFENVDTSNVSPEGTYNNWNRASFLTQLSWERAQSDRLLYRLGYSAALAPGRVNAYSPGVTPGDVPITLQNNGYAYHANGGISGTIYGHPVYNEQNGLATVAYVTGSHALKAGFTWQWSNQNYKEHPNIVPGLGPVSYVFNQAAGAPEPTPVSLTEYAAPLTFTSRSWVDAFYGQDQWTIGRLTLNLGLRFDLERGYAPAQSEPATTFTPAQSFPAVNDIPDWNDIEPRLGAAYDLFGNAKSAIKGSIGRFVLGDYTSTTVSNTPANSIVTSATRSWTMTAAEIAASNGNYVPNCNLLLTTANGDCGALSNSKFGQAVQNTTYDPAVLSGWNTRPYNWQTDIQFQQEIRPGFGATVGYYRTSYGNFTVTENTAVLPTDFTGFCITGPVDPRVSELTGQTICGFHDVNPSAYGKVNNYVTKASAFGGQSEVYNGFDVRLSARYGHGGFVSGGVASGNTTYNDCAIANKYPNVTATETNPLGSISSNNTTPAQFCAYSIAWSKQTQWKADGTYPLPWYGISAGFTFQNMPGYLYNTNYVATAAQIQQSLGRPLSSGAKTLTLTNALYAPFSESENRLDQLDLRFTKVFKIKDRLQIKANLDVYNISNSNTILTEAATYSATNSYLKPTSILGPRMFKLGTNISF